MSTQEIRQHEELKERIQAEKDALLESTQVPTILVDPATVKALAAAGKMWKEGIHPGRNYFMIPSAEIQQGKPEWVNRVGCWIVNPADVLDIRRAMENIEAVEIPPKNISRQTLRALIRTLEKSSHAKIRNLKRAVRVTEEKLRKAQATSDEARTNESANPTEPLFPGFSRSASSGNNSPN